ncbi:MAG: hypothetical protein AMXMBFR7_15090 [Planctomycetota bacterium]
MRDRWRPSLGHLFLASVSGLALLLGLLFALILQSSRAALMEVSERMRDDAARQLGARVREHLGQAAEAVAAFEARVQRGAVQPRDAADLERDFFAQLAAQPGLIELTLTTAEARRDAGGAWQADAATGAQVSVFRAAPEADGERIVTRRVLSVPGGGFASQVRLREPGAKLDGVAWSAEAGTTENPVLHPTFQGVVGAGAFGAAAWSELHRSALDARLPLERQRVVLTVQQALVDAEGKFLGVLRAGFATEELDRITQVRLAEGAADPHRVFLVNGYGGLLTGLGEESRLIETATDLRVDPSAAPAEVRAALAEEPWRMLSDAAPRYSGAFELEGTRYLMTFRRLGEGGEIRGGLADGAVGIVAPEAHYLGGLLEMQRRLTWAAALVMAAILIGGGWTLRKVRCDLVEVVDETARMRDFSFEPRAREVALREVGTVLDGLELAKTAARAMSRYVPVGLVRQLYRSGREPELGGELRELSILFTDIKDFTQCSERLAPDELARYLGLYLETMTAAVHAQRGAVDKFIGDAVMALWNAPEAVADHAAAACAAALDALARTQALYASEAWRGGPAWETRLGLHVGPVMVGHFGSPERMNYTALGDGVNLASRLEGLNKTYGTTILASASIREAAGKAFEFRLIDRVAVKGRTQALCVYELLGAAGTVPAVRLEAARAYDRAFEAYVKGDFAAARALWEAQPGDLPSRTMAARCVRLLDAPPLSGWNGVYVATSK